MAEGRGRLVWDAAAELLAMMANCHRDPKKSRAYKASYFHPYKNRVSIKFPVQALKKIFGTSLEARTIRAKDVKVAKPEGSKDGVS